MLLSFNTKIIKNKKISLFLLSLVYLWALIPLFLTKYIVTADLPAHLYLSNILKDFLFTKTDLYTGLYELNIFYFPQWSLSITLAILLYFFPVYWAEKIFIALVLYTLLLGIKRFSKFINPKAKQPLVVFLIVPLFYGHLFYTGLFSFYWSIGLAFLLAPYLIQSKKIIPKLLICILLYFTHFMGFLLAISLVFAQYIFIDKKPIKKRFSHLIINLLPFVPMIGVYLAYNSSQNEKSYTYETKADLTSSLLGIRSLSTFDVSFEIPIYYSLLFLMLAVLFLNRKQIKMNTWSFVFLIASVLSLSVYYLAPTSDGYVAYISIRFQWFILFFLSISVISLKLNQKYQGIIVIFCIILSSALFYKRYLPTSVASNNIEEVINKTEPIPQGSIIVPLKTSNDWLKPFALAYLGVEKKHIILDYYFFYTLYYPIRWKDDGLLNFTIGKLEKSKNMCVGWPMGRNNKKSTITYVILEGNSPNNCFDKYIYPQLNHFYHAEKLNQYYTLFTLKN